MVLLALMVESGRPFKAIHINHQLSANADQWMAHCQRWCKQYGVPLITERVSVELTGRGLEAAARDARYQAIAAHIEPSAQLLTAHHQDDQAETVLLRLMRGAGPTGLAGIRARQWFQVGQVGFWMLRPLLPFDRQTLEQFARARNLRWVEDESNQDARFDRNYLRTHILPGLQERWPSAGQRLAQTAQLCESNQRLLDQLALADGQALTAGQAPSRMGWRLPLHGLSALSVERRTNLLRYWMARWPLALDTVQLEELWRQLVSAAEDAQVKFSLKGAELRRFGNTVWLLPLQEAGPAYEQMISPGQVLRFGNGQVRLVAESNGLALPAEGGFLLRARAGGERAQPEGRGHSQTLKKLLQARGLAPWLRDQLPLLYQSGQLAAVADLWLEQGAVRASDGWRLEWQLPQNQPPF